MFWFDHSDPRAVFVDKRQESHTLPDVSSAGGSRELVISPDLQADFTSLPFPDASFALVVFDPPHFRAEWCAVLGRAEIRHGGKAMIQIPTFEASDLYRQAAGCAPYAQTACSALAKSQVAKLDAVIREELNRILGTDCWEIHDLARRVRIEKEAEFDYETYFLDNKPFLRVWPPVVQFNNDGLKTTATVTQNYRTYCEQNTTVDPRPTGKGENQ